MVVVNFFPDGYFVPGPLRLPVGLGDKNGVVQDGGPKSMKGRVFDDKGAVVVKELTVERHFDGVPRPYWPVMFELGTPGSYRLELDTPKGKANTGFTVTDPAKVIMPKPGDKMRPFVTPTPTSPGGVNPICTRNPICNLHNITLTDALAAGKPVAFLISTPAHCQQSVCGPILDLVIEQAERLADKVTTVHAEVYTDDTIVDVSPAVAAYDILFEPALWLADASGTIVNRLDVVFDRAELRLAFDQLAK
jgi:hypothetical protein